ncbi:MAG: hypothetical protein NVS3B20_22220 [Polyangiales bacterium]
MKMQEGHSKPGTPKHAKRAGAHLPTSKKRFASASVLQGERVVVNIAGNKYLLIALVDYQRKGILVRFVGTHAEHDHIDAQTF